eukprot:TRINITY_DN3160_c0_g1_i1.p1 TRINITY_DN3160_c0_g1~~TRINITY_DN3160_c0_g1_i1.p1  ORF type:complete len:546 (-),score=126.59 TRINITY_DN3160_c0_g1_i1:29-1666(-)
MDVSEPLIRNRKKGSSPYTLSALVRKAEVNAFPDPEGGEALKRVLSVWELIAYGVASTVGAGVFVTVGLVGKSIAGPAMVISFLLAGFSSLLSALCYSEFATRIPVAGSAYTFAYVSLGELMGWFVGWNLTLEYAISASAVARGWAGYFVDAIEKTGVIVPKWIHGYDIAGTGGNISLSLLSLSIIVLCTLVLLFGVKESAKFNMVITVVNLAIILFVIIAGSIYVKPHNYHDFAPFGIQGIWKGVGTVFFSYIGFDSVSTLASEVKNPARDLPIGIVGTLLIASALYVAVSMVVTGMVYYPHLNADAPLSAAFFSVGLSWAGYLVAVGSVTTMTATTLVSLIGQPRIFYQMSQDGLIFSALGRLNKKGAPSYGTVVTGIMSGVIALCFNLDGLANMISIGTLLAFIVVCGGVVVLRKRDDEKPYKPALMVGAFCLACVIWAVFFTYLLDVWPYALIFAGILVIATFIPIVMAPTTDVPVTFACPLVPWIPCLGMFMNIWFIVTLPYDAIIRLIVWTIIGMLIYAFYGIRNSTLYVKTLSEDSIN